jgi:hypothetical protein
VAGFRCSDCSGGVSLNSTIVLNSKILIGMLSLGGPVYHAADSIEPSLCGIMHGTSPRCLSPRLRRDFCCLFGSSQTRSTFWPWLLASSCHSHLCRTEYLVPRAVLGEGCPGVHGLERVGTPVLFGACSALFSLGHFRGSIPKAIASVGRLTGNLRRRPLLPRAKKPVSDRVRHTERANVF